MKVSELFEAKAKALVKVVARKNPNGTHGPTGTFTVKSFEKDGNSVYVKIQDNGGWGISFENPPAFLKFVRADNSQPITLAAAYKLWQDSQKPVKEGLKTPKSIDDILIGDQVEFKTSTGRGEGGIARVVSKIGSKIKLTQGAGTADFKDIKSVINMPGDKGVGALSTRDLKRSVREGYDTSEKNREYHDDFAEWKSAVRHAGGDYYMPTKGKSFYVANAHDGKCGEFDTEKGEGWIVDKWSKTKVNESTDHLEDAIRDNWLSTPVSKIVKILKDKIKSGEKEWQYLKGKSDEDLEDLVDDAKYQARNQYS